MANIKVNEISRSYSITINPTEYCTVALPITACWGPAFEDPASLGIDEATELENTGWIRFPATQEGLEAFVATYRGPSSNYRITKDYSYQEAMTLLTSGYAVLTCRLCPGTHASATIPAVDGDGSTGSTGSLELKAKYSGTFGNNLRVKITKQKLTATAYYLNLIVYSVDSAGGQTAVENKVFVLDPINATDTIPSIDVLESEFLTFSVSGQPTEDDLVTTSNVALTGGADDFALGNAPDMVQEAVDLAEARFGDIGETSTYVAALMSVKNTATVTTAAALRFNEWIYTHCVGTSLYNGIYDLLSDQLTYNPNRIVSPWDDQNILAINPDMTILNMAVSPIHKKLMDIAYISRCATAYIDIPKSLPRNRVWDDSEANVGYAQQLSSIAEEKNDPLYATHSALFAPWGQYVYVGTSKQSPATPSFQALMLERAMIRNQASQYEWAMPTSRRNTVPLGKLDYTVPKNLLDQWQSSEGVRVNVITSMPDMGPTLWGNSTLFNIPPASYQALQNLSTRKLFNAIEDVVFKVGLGIQWHYSNSESFSRFYTGVTPLLDTMRDIGAIEDYAVNMAADINSLDQVNANSVVGQIVIVVAGVIENLTVDLIALPQGSIAAEGLNG
jgi:hypothetical protein